MTIICWDGKTLAGDGRVTTSSGLIISDIINKLVTFEEPLVLEMFDSVKIYAAGFSGDNLSCNKLIRLMSKCSKDNIDNLDNYFNERYFDIFNGEKVSGILVGEDLVYELTEEGEKEEYPLDSKITIGSGWLVGLSALRLGLTSCVAVRHVINMNVHCGGLISSWDHPKFKRGL